MKFVVIRDSNNRRLRHQSTNEARRGQAARAGGSADPAPKPSLLSPGCPVWGAGGSVAETGNCRPQGPCVPAQSGRALGLPFTTRGPQTLPRPENQRVRVGPGICLLQHWYHHHTGKHGLPAFSCSQWTSRKSTHCGFRTSVCPNRDAGDLDNVHIKVERAPWRWELEFEKQPRGQLGPAEAATEAETRRSQ